MRDRNLIKRRQVWFLPEDEMNGSLEAEPVEDNRRPARDLEEATLVSSAVEVGDLGAVGSFGPTHMPVIDVDFPIVAVPSKTDGHFHLYIQKQVSWPQYVVLLQALYHAGIIEPGYYSTSIKRQQTFVRWPRTEGREENDEARSTP